MGAYLATRILADRSNGSEPSAEFDLAILREIYNIFVNRNLCCRYFCIPVMGSILFHVSDKTLGRPAFVTIKTQLTLILCYAEVLSKFKNKSRYSNKINYVTMLEPG